MIYTDHAERRMQQRAIPVRAIELLQRFGCIEYSNGARIRYFDKRSRKRAIDAMSEPTNADLDRLRGMYFVETNEGVIITAGHRTRPIKRNFKPGMHQTKRQL